MITFCRNGMSGRSSSEDIGDKTFVVAFQGEIHLPVVFRRPVPIEHIFSAVAIPIKLHLMPKHVDFIDYRFLLCHSRIHILSYTKQTCHQETALHQVASIVFFAERFHLACGTVKPVRPHTMEAVSFSEVVNNFIKSSHTLGSRYKAAFDAHNKPGNTEAAAADSHRILVVLRIYTVEMYAFASQARSGFGTIPHVIKVRFLEIVEKLVVIVKLSHRVLLLGKRSRTALSLRTGG